MPTEHGTSDHGSFLLLCDSCLAVQTLSQLFIPGWIAAGKAALRITAFSVPDQDQRSAKFWLDSVELVRNMGFRAHEIRRICSIIDRNQSMLLEAWNGYFGT